LKPLVLKGILIWCDEHGIKFQDVETLEKEKRSGKAYVRINGTFGLPTPFELIGDERWAPDGELYLEWDFELDDVNDQGSLNDEVVEATLNNENDRNKIMDFSKMHQALGDKVLSENNAFENKNIGDNGGRSATYSEISAGRLTEEPSGILSFN